MRHSLVVGLSLTLLCAGSAWGTDLMNVQLSGGSSSTTLNAGATFSLELHVAVTSDILSAEGRLHVAKSGGGGGGALVVQGPATVGGQVPAYPADPEGPWDNNAAANDGLALEIVSGAIDADSDYNPGGSRIGAIGLNGVGPDMSWPSPQRLATLNVKIADSATPGVYTISATDVFFCDWQLATIPGTTGNTVQVTVGGAEASVVGRYVFYNNSFYDTPSTGTYGCNTLFNGGLPCNDNTAIDTSKTALLPGQAAGTANYINYKKGINGIMVDIDNMPGTPTVADFQFHEMGRKPDGTSPTGHGAVVAAAPLSVTTSAVSSSVKRVKIIWADNAITNMHWLRITVLATAQTGLLANDVFYYGLQIGEAGSPGGTGPYALVDGTDVGWVKTNPRNLTNRPPVTHWGDMDRNGLVDGTDVGYVKTNGSNVGNAIFLTAAPP